MILTDNETKVDLLNNEAIASTIVKLLRGRPEQPVTVGVHGDCVERESEFYTQNRGWAVCGDTKRFEARFQLVQLIARTVALVAAPALHQRPGQFADGRK